MNLDLVTSTDEATRAKLFRKLAKLPLVNQLQVMKNGQNWQHIHAGENKNLSQREMLFASIIVGMKSFFTEAKFNRNDLEGERKKLKKKEIIRVERIKTQTKRVGPKYRKILNHWLLIEKLRIVDKLSFPQIVLYLKQHHKLQVDASYINKLWNEKYAEGL